MTESLMSRCRNLRKLKRAIDEVFDYDYYHINHNIDISYDDKEGQELIKLIYDAIDIRFNLNILFDSLSKKKKCLSATFVRGLNIENYQSFLDDWNRYKLNNNEKYQEYLSIKRT